MRDYEEFDDQIEEGHEELETAFPSHEDVMAAQRITMRDITEHMTGPVVSIILHIIVLALVGTIVVMPAPKEGTEIEVEVKELEVKELEKIPEPPEPPEEQEVDVEVEIERPDVSVTDVEVEVEAVAVDDTAVDVQMPDLLAVKPNSSALRLPGIMAARGGKGRRGALKSYGGSGRTEKAVSRGLQWLADHQNEDGSWGVTRGSKPALTALALLAFLAHGETPASQKYGSTVLSAIQKLIEYSQNTKAEGYIVCDGSTYGHSIVAYALSEAYGMTKIPMIEQAMNSTIATIVKGINSMGAFNYRYDNSANAETGGQPRCDLSYSGWNYQALKAAFAAGCTVEGLEDCIDKSIKGLKTSNYCGQGFTYTQPKTKPGRGSISMTPVGVLCLQLFGEGKSEEAESGLKTLIEVYRQGGKGGSTTDDYILEMDWKAAIDGGAASSHWPIYRWYYTTQAIFQGYQGKKSSPWGDWNKSFTRSLTKEQESDGHWSTPDYKYGDRKGEARAHGNFSDDMDTFVYSTALCCLMLEVYYRYLPTFKVSKAKVPAAAAEDDADDLGITIE